MQALLALAVFWPGTVVDIPPLEIMVERADVIAHAVVKGATVVKDDQGRIFTRTTIEILDGIKGAKAGDSVVVSQLGGLYEGRNLWIAGAHRFRVGEEMIFFGAAWKDGMVVPFGVGFGVFDVVDDGNGRRVVREMIGDVVAVKRRTGAKAVPDGRPEPRAYEDVDAFKNMLRDALKNTAVSTGQPKRIKQKIDQVRVRR